MAKTVKIGEMRTRITVKRVTHGMDADGFGTQTETALFGGEKIWCKWVWEHGNEVYEHRRLKIGQKATITMMYTPEIDQRCRIWREDETGDAKAWEIIRINNVEDANKTMEITARRSEKA